MPAAREGHPFDVDTSVQLEAASFAPNGNPFAVYSARISERWGLTSSGGFANGGYVLSTCLRAAAERLGHPDPVAVSATYLSRTRFGPARLEVETVRQGRRLSTAEIRVIQDGAGAGDGPKEKVRVVATFGDLDAAEGTTDVRNEAPSLPPPEACLAPPVLDSMPGFTLAGRVEWRYPTLPGWHRGEPGGQLSDEFWIRIAPGEDGTERHADPIAVAGLVDMATPPVIDLGESGSTTIQLSVHVRGRPAPGWLACRVSTRHVMDGLHDEDFEIWDSAGCLVAQSRQLAILGSRRWHG